MNTKSFFFFKKKKLYSTCVLFYNRFSVFDFPYHCSNVMKIRRHSPTVYTKYIRTYVVLFIVIVFALKVVHSGYRFFTVFSIHFVIIYSANNIYYDNNNNKAIELKKNNNKK